jgi:hypothetical protein
MTLDTNMLKTSSSSSWCPTKLAKARRVYITRDAMIGFQTLRIASQRCFLCSSLDKSAPSAVLHFALLNSLTASQLRNADGRKLSIASLFEECDQSTSHCAMKKLCDVVVAQRTSACVRTPTVCLTPNEGGDERSLRSVVHQQHDAMIVRSV